MITPLRRPRADRRAFTVIELVVVLVIVALVGLVASASVSNVRSRANQSVSERSLETVEMSQRIFFDRVGSWTKDPSLLGGLRDVTATASQSTGPDRVSISYDWQRNLWLSVLDDEGNCVTRRVPDPMSNEQAVVTVAKRTCDAGSAAVEFNGF